MKKIRRAKAPGPARTDPRVQMVPLQGGLRLAVHALTAGLELVSSDWPDEGDVDWPVYDGGLRLARDIVAAAAAPGAPDDAALGNAARAHYERVTAPQATRGCGSDRFARTCSVASPLSRAV